MKRFIMLFLSFVLSVTGMPIVALAETAEQTVTVSDQTVVTHGRTYYQDGFLWFNWTYSGFSFAFNGTAAKGVFQSGEHNGAYLNVYVDGSLVPANTIILKGTTRTFTIIDGLESGYHVITVRKRTENRGNATAGISQLILTGTLAEALPVKPTKTIEVIGDSITCGFGNLLDGSKYSGYQAKGQDGTRTFATLATSRFDAETTVISRSGIGYKYNNGGAGDVMMDVYDETDYFHLNGTAWDFENNPSDLVIIALGTNDTSAPSHDAFYQGAKEFLAKVREKNPDAIIIWAYEVITASFNHLIQQAIIDANMEGDDKVYYYALGLIDQETDGIGLDGHPSITTHIKDAKGFAQFIAETTGWELGAENTSVTVNVQADSPLILSDNGLLIAPASYCGKSLAELKEQLVTDGLTFTDEAGNEASDTAFLTTGMTVVRTEKPFVLDTRQLCILGDVDQNGAVNASDALAILKYAVGKTDLTDSQMTAAWVAGGESISAGDALEVLQYSVGKIEEL